MITDDDEAYDDEDDRNLSSDMNDGGSVQVVSQLEKKQRQQTSWYPEEESSFISWWPRTAKVVLNGLYGSEDQKKEAVKSLSPILTQYVKNDPPAFEVKTRELIPLYDLYKRKLEYDKQEIRFTVTSWTDIIQSFIESAKELVNKKNLILQEIDQSGKKIYAAFSTKVDTSILKETILSREDIYKGFIERCTSLEIRAIRCEIMSRHTSRNAMNHDINIEIENESQKLSESVPTEAILAIKSIYSTHLQNIESQAAEDIKNLCLHSWIHALK